jgi:hypothetical protein
MKIVRYKELKQTLEEQLQKIEELAEQKAEEIEKNYYEKYYPLYDLAIQILKKHEVLLYGGSAINEILPKKLRFYKEDELPDIDVFCKSKDYARISKDILSQFEKKGYVLTTIKEALHENTYKIMTEGLQLIDITVVKEDIFEILKKGAMNTSFGISTVNLDYLKYSLHNLLSLPLDAHRWPKVFQRLVYVYEAYPLKVDHVIHLEDYYVSIPIDIQTKLDTYIHTKKNLISFGWDVIQLYLSTDDTVAASYKKKFLWKNPDKSFAAIQYIVVDKNLLSEAKELVKHLGKEAKLEFIDSGDEFVPEYVCISYDGRHWIYIFMAPNCSSYHTYQTKRIFSIHSVIKYLYIIYVSSGDKNVYAMIQMLTLVQLNNSLSKKQLFQQFILDCYGYQKGLVTLRKERFERIMKKKKNI